MENAGHSALTGTIVAHEEILATLLSRVLVELPQDQLNALHARMKRGPIINPDAPQNLDLDLADQVAGIGIEYDVAIKRIFAQALQLAGRSVA